MQPLFISVENKLTNETVTYTFASSPIRVGRNPLNDLRLHFPFVSEWHAIIRFDSGHSHYIDLGSTNGSRIDQTRMPKNVLTEVGQDTQLSIVSIVLRFSRTPPATGVVAQAAGIAPNPIPRPPSERVSRLYLAAVSREETETSASLGANTLVHAQQQAFVENALRPLGPNYEAYRQAWDETQKQLMTCMQDMTRAQKAIAIKHVAKSFPHMSCEPEFQEMARQSGEVPAPTGKSETVSPSLLRLADAFLPRTLSIRNRQDEERFAGRIANVLEGFGGALVELLKGHQQFGEQMAVRAMVNPSVLQRSRSSREILAYLLDWREGADERMQELISAFADLMIHQVALLNGVVEGAKGMLSEISPEAIVEQSKNLGGAWGFGSGKYWQLFTERFSELANDDSRITRSVFGRNFARAYVTVIGQQQGIDERDRSR